MKRLEKLKGGDARITARIARTLALLFPTVARADNVTHSYDNLDRLVRTDYGNGQIIEYTYDAAGNRTNQKVTMSNQSPTANAGPDQPA